MSLRARAGFEQQPRFDEVRHQDAVHEEAGAVVHEQRQFADLLHKLDRALDCCRVGGGAREPLQPVASGALD